MLEGSANEGSRDSRPGMEGAETRRQRVPPTWPCVSILGMSVLTVVPASRLSASCPSSASSAALSLSSKMRAASAGSSCSPLSPGRAVRSLA